MTAPALTHPHAGRKLESPISKCRIRPVSAVFLFVPSSMGKVFGIRKDRAVHLAVGAPSPPRLLADHPVSKWRSS